MFSERTLDGDVAAVRDEHAPDTLVFDCERDFETIPPAQAEELGLLVDTVDPASAPAEWVPEDAPELLHRFAGEQFTIGMPGDGSVVWTRQTDPPAVFVKPRLEGSPEPFVDFLLAEAFVEVGLDEPEQFLQFFGPSYPEFHAAAAPVLEPTETYQVATACYDAYLGLQTRDIFAGWDDTHSSLFGAWLDAGERLEPRLSGLSTAMARGETDFGDAAELACSAVKHAAELPAPFSALDADAYREHGPSYAVQWAERTFEALS
ncbi:DUF7089 family protein [Salinibaculum rarum]|uniref:DUF7089 family protein n=1 Tax=Salinibaculum rarum TaxID=3058903 RepID=UPI00265E401C|nr:hypothetical protein [Salinibaculum sp. KK48]